MTTLDRTPIPRIQPRRGFAWLPLAQQLSVFALLALVILAFLPLTIDSGRAGSGQLKQAMLKPRSVSGAIARLERHYTFAWRANGSAGEQRLRQKLLAIALGICVLGAVAGWNAQPAPSATTASGSTIPRSYGTASPIRTRSAVAMQEGQYG